MLPDLPHIQAAIMRRMVPAADTTVSAEDGMARPATATTQRTITEREIVIRLWHFQRGADHLDQCSSVATIFLRAARSTCTSKTV